MSQDAIKLQARAANLRAKGSKIKSMPIISRVAAAQSLGEEVADYLVDLSAAVDRLEVSNKYLRKRAEDAVRFAEMTARRVNNLDAANDNFSTELDEFDEIDDDTAAELDGMRDIANAEAANYA